MAVLPTMALSFIRAIELARIRWGDA